MAYRFSDTLKWSDTWFVDLSSIEKLLFLYLCDNCDIGGFFELSIRKIAFDLGSSQQSIEGAIKGLSRGLILSEDESCVLIKNFIKHQKNLPLNNANKAHKGIISRYNMYAVKFPGLILDHILGYKIEAPSKPLQRGTGIGIGNDIDKDDYTYNNIIGDFEEKKDDDSSLIPEPEIIDPDKKSKLINALVLEFGFSEHKFSQQRSIIMSFVTNLEFTDMFTHFIDQFKNYKLYKAASKEKTHSFKSLIGTVAEQFNDGQWNNENWKEKLEGYKLQNKIPGKVEAIINVFDQIKYKGNE